MNWPDIIAQVSGCLALLFTVVAIRMAIWFLLKLGPMWDARQEAKEKAERRARTATKWEVSVAQCNYWLENGTEEQRKLARLVLYPPANRDLSKKEDN